KVELRRRHPADHRRLGRLLTHEVLRQDAQIIETLADSQKIRQRDRDGEVTRMRIAASGGCWTPQSEHRSFSVANEQEDDVPARIAVAEFQTDDPLVKLL